MGSAARLTRVANKDTGASGEPKKIEDVVRSLRTLLVGDEREQRETFTSLRQALDEDRLSGRKLFSSP
jgi:hypothetical protein